MSELDINKVLELFSALDIAELNYKDKERELVLRKAVALTAVQVAPVVAQVQASVTPAAAPAVATSAPAKTEAPAAPTAEKEDASVQIVKSPLVGSFYRAPAPGQPDFVQVGKRVNKGDKLCIVEAMKVMNVIDSEFSGEIVEILVESGAIVEFGTPLMKIKA